MLVIGGDHGHGSAMLRFAIVANTIRDRRKFNVHQASDFYARSLDSHLGDSCF